MCQFFLWTTKQWLRSEGKNIHITKHQVFVSATPVHWLLFFLWLIEREKRTELNRFSDDGALYSAVEFDGSCQKIFFFLFTLNDKLCASFDACTLVIRATHRCVHVHLICPKISFKHERISVSV